MGVQMRVRAGIGLLLALTIAAAATLLSVGTAWAASLVVTTGNDVVDGSDGQ